MSIRTTRAILHCSVYVHSIALPSKTSYESIAYPVAKLRCTRTMGRLTQIQASHRQSYARSTKVRAADNQRHVREHYAALLLESRPAATHCSERRTTLPPRTPPPPRPPGRPVAGSRRDRETHSRPTEEARAFEVGDSSGPQVAGPTGARDHLDAAAGPPSRSHLVTICRLR